MERAKEVGLRRPQRKTGLCLREDLGSWEDAAVLAEAAPLWGAPAATQQGPGNGELVAGTRVSCVAPETSPCLSSPHFPRRANGHTALKKTPTSLPATEDISTAAECLDFGPVCTQ